MELLVEIVSVPGSLSAANMRGLCNFEAGADARALTMEDLETLQTAVLGSLNLGFRAEQSGCGNAEPERLSIGAEKGNK